MSGGEPGLLWLPEDIDLRAAPPRDPQLARVEGTGPDRPNRPRAAPGRRPPAAPPESIGEPAAGPPSPEAAQPEPGRRADRRRPPLGQARRGRRLRRGQDHLRRLGLGDRPADHRGRPDRRRLRRRRRRHPADQAGDDGGHGLRPGHRRPGPGALPVRHARPGALLVHVGRHRGRQPRRGGAGRHPPPGGVLSGRRLLRVPPPALRGRREPLRGGARARAGRGPRGAGRAGRGAGRARRRPPPGVGQVRPAHAAGHAPGPGPGPGPAALGPADGQSGVPSARRDVHPPRGGGPVPPERT